MAKKNSGLGRGLDAIFLDNTIAEENVHSEEKISKLKKTLFSFSEPDKFSLFTEFHFYRISADLNIGRTV